MKTEFKDSLGKVIKVGDNIDIVGTNVYNGTVNIENGAICLETAFFNRPLVFHLQAHDFKFAYIRNPRGVKPGTKRAPYATKKIETVTINFRVPKDRSEAAKDFIRPLLKEFLNFPLTL